ncbi:hypothetical protein [Streptomyces brasiliscabiei]|uniref:Uncharacterized protein n=1 Tax=Streptomyces brasiliscabiei TaxID=2736302 RepID=A0ABU8GLS0_9ACTN
MERPAAPPNREKGKLPGREAAEREVQQFVTGSVQVHRRHDDLVGRGGAWLLLGRLRADQGHRPIDPRHDGHADVTHEVALGGRRST